MRTAGEVDNTAASAAGGAVQIVLLRWVIYYLLAYTVFSQRRGYRELAIEARAGVFTPIDPRS